MCEILVILFVLVLGTLLGVASWYVYSQSDDLLEEEEGGFDERE